MQISLDTSFLAHALQPDQQTPGAVSAFRGLIASNDLMFGAAGVFVEFPSLLRKFITRQTLTRQEVNELFEEFLDYGIMPVLPTLALQRRAWAVAGLLG